MATSAIVIDPSTGERVQSGGIQIDPATGERVGSSDTRNAAQKFVDNLTTVTPQQEQGHGTLFNKAQEFGAGAIQGATAPIVHPLNTLQSLGNTIAHPIDTAKAMYESAKANPAQFAGNLVGGSVLGEATAPAIAPIVKGVGKAADAVGVPQALYKSALKPSTALSQADRAKLVASGLQNEIPVTPQGFQDLGDKITALNQASKDVIAADPTRQISTAPALQRLQSVRGKFQNQVAPAEDVQAIDKVGQEFAAQAPNGSLAADQAQAMKQGTYATLGSKAYGELKGAQTEAMKSLAGGLKDELARQFPELNTINPQLSGMLKLQPVLERALSRTENHQLIGLSGPLTGLAAEAITGHPGIAITAGLLKAVVDSPEFKSKLGIALSKASNIPIAAANAKVAAYSSGLGAYAGVAAGQQPNQ